MPGQVVGTISIKVTPDTSKFRRELYAELQEIERAEAAKVPVKADFDSNDLKAKVEAAAKAADSTTHVKVDVDENGIRRKLDMLNTAFEGRVSRALEKKPLMPESFAELQRRMDTLDLGWDRKVKAALEEFNKPIRLTLDEEFTHKLKQGVLADVERSVKLRPHLDEAGIEEMRLRLAHENFTAKVKLETDSARLQNTARRIGSDFDKELDKIFGARSSGPGLLSGLVGRASARGGNFHPPDIIPDIGGLGPAASLGVIAAVASLAGPALSLFSQALVSLPAVLAAVTVPIGVFALGIGGIKKALEDTSILSEDKKGKLHFGDVIKRISQPIDDIFEQGFKPLFQSVIGTMASAPVFTRGLQFIAHSIVDFAGGLTKSLTDAGNLTNLDRMTNSIGTMLMRLAPGMTTFSNAMIRLTTDVTDHLPGAATAINGWIDRFSNWIATVDKKGPNGAPSELDSAVSNMKPILNSVVDFVGKLTDAGLQIAANPQMADNIKKVVDSIGNAILGLLPPLNQLFDKLSGFLHWIAPNAPDTDPFGNPLKGPDGKPVVNPAIGPVVPAPPNAPQQAGVPKGFMQDISKNPKAQEIIAQWHKDTDFDPNANGFQNLWRHLRRIFGAPDLRPAGIQPTVMEAGVGAPPQPQAPKPFNQNGYQQFQQGAGAMLLGQGGQQPAQLPPQLAPALQPKQVPQVGQEAQAQADAAKKAFDGIPAAAQAAMAACVDAVKSGSAQIVAIFTGLGPQIVGAINGIQGLMVGAGANLAAGLAAGIRAGTPAVAAAATDLAKAAEGAAKGHLDIHSPSRLFQTIGQQTSAGFQTGIEDGFQGVIASATGLAKQLQDAVQGGMMPAGLRDNVKQELSAISQQYDQLKVDRDRLGPKDKAGRKAISDKLAQLNSVRDELKLGEDKLGPTKKHGPSTDSMSQSAQLITSALAQGLDGAKSLVMSNVNQFESDIGISGQGAIPIIGNIGLQWGTQMLNGLIGGAFGQNPKKGGDTHIHVQSTDEAMAVHRAEQNRKAMTYAGR